MKATFNAVIVGQTGVGKSSLINYIYGSKVAKTGVGKPVTKNGFFPIKGNINGLPICLFDSWGLEVGKFEKWIEELDKECINRGVDQSANKWFHSIFYCISAGGARIQDCDIEIINKFIDEKYKISVILTKCDQVSEEVEGNLKEELQKRIKDLPVISVCSEEKKTRIGTSKPFGKEAVECQTFDDFFDSLILRLPLRCENVMKKSLSLWVKESNDKADNIGLFGLAQEEVARAIENDTEFLNTKIHKLVNNEINNTLDMYADFATHLGYSFSEVEFINGNFGLEKNNTDIPWWGIPIVIPASFIVIPLELVFGFIKNDNIKETKEYIDKCNTEFEEIIDNQVTGVTKMLKSLNSKAKNKVKDRVLEVA